VSDILLRPYIWLGILAAAAFFAAIRLSAPRPLPDRFRSSPGLPPRSVLDRIVEGLSNRLDLNTAASDPALVLWLKRAGLYRRPAALAYLMARLFCPLLAIAAAGIWMMLSGALAGSAPGMVVVLGCVGLAGYAAPAIYVQNLVQRRQAALRRHFPDALDLLLLSVDSGLGIDAALDEVARHLTIRAPELAQELRLTLAEMSYLSDRKQAFANLASRTEIAAISTVTTALVQAERYGTPIGTTLRALTRDSRATRTAEAERQAASLPPRLTIPMILFFLPVLFAVIFTPGVILYLMDH
jgi:tight adherence protein C